MAGYCLRMIPVVVPTEHRKLKQRHICEQDPWTAESQQGILKARPCHEEVTPLNLDFGVLTSPQLGHTGGCR